MSLRAFADPYARKLGFYTAYTLDGELVKEDLKTVPAVKHYLQLQGFEATPTIGPVPLEAAKRHPETGSIHEASLRYVDPDDPMYQYHAHLWEGDTVTEIHSHRELRPDMKRIGEESYRDMRDRLQNHYRPGDTYEKRAVPSFLDPK